MTTTYHTILSRLHCLSKLWCIQLDQMNVVIIIAKCSIGGNRSCRQTHAGSYTPGYEQIGRLFCVNTPLVNPHLLMREQYVPFVLIVLKAACTDLNIFVSFLRIAIPSRFALITAPPASKRSGYFLIK